MVNRAYKLCTLLPLLLMLCSAAKLNWSWIVPGGELQLDRRAINSRKFCALTFDDGPDAMYTAEIGRILSRQSVPGTFFVLGKNVKKFPNVLPGLISAGHEIESHSWSHPDFTKAGAEKGDKELADTNTELAKYGVTPHWFRPPYGAYNKVTLKLASEHGMQSILWSVDPRDWSKPGVEVIVNRVLEGVQPGAVILLHSTNPQTVAALPWIIDGLEKKGYDLVSISEWARLISGGTLGPPPGAPLSVPEPAPDAPLMPDGRPAPVALNVIANFDGPGELAAVLNTRVTASLYHFSYAASRLAPQLEESPAATGGLFAGVTQGAQDLPVREPLLATGVPVPGTAVNEPQEANLWNLVLASPEWQFPQSFDTAAFDETATGPFVPNFYLIKSAGGAWSGSASVNSLLTAGRFSGVVVASEFNLTGSLRGLAAPSALYSVGRLDPSRVVNLSRQDTSTVLVACGNGAASIFATMNPSDLVRYRDTQDPASVRYLPEFLLLRWATEGLQTSPDETAAIAGVIPAGMTFAVFTGDRGKLLVLRGSAGATGVALSWRAVETYYLTRLKNDDTVECSLLHSSNLAVGDQLVIISDYPLVEQ